MALQKLLIGRRGEDRTEIVVLRSITESNVEVAKPQTFNRTVSKMSEFLMEYMLDIRMRMKEMAVKE